MKIPDLVAHIRDTLDRQNITRQAVIAAAGLTRNGMAFLELEPGDGTRYDVAVIDQYASTGPHLPGGRYLFASNFGRLRALPHFKDIHPTYIAEHYVADNNLPTAVVFAEFLDRLGTALDAIAEDDPAELGRIIDGIMPKPRAHHHALDSVGGDGLIIRPIKEQTS